MDKLHQSKSLSTSGTTSPGKASPLSDSREELRTDLSFVLLALIWGVNFTVVKSVLLTLNPLALNALRFPLASLVMLVLLRRRTTGPPLGRQGWTRILLLAFLGHVCYQLAFIYGIDWTFAGNASLLLATTPIWTVILSVASRHEEAGALLWAGIAITVVGMVLVVVGGEATLVLGEETVRGDLLMVGGAVLWSVYTVGARRPVTRFGSLRVTAWTLWAGTPFVVGMGVPQLMATDWEAVSTGTWAGVIYSGVFSIGVAYVIWYRGVERIGTSRTAVYSNLVPVAALLTAWLWLDEVPSPLQLMGAAVILGGLCATRKAKARQLPEVPPDPA